MANLYTLSPMRKKERIRQSIVKNNIFMLGKLGIDLESPTCIVDLFNKLVLFIEASEENKNASKLLEDQNKEEEVKYGGIKEPEFVPEDSESEECCTDLYSKLKIEDPSTVDHPKTDKPTVNFPTVKLPEKRPTTLLELKRKISEKLRDVTNESWLVNVPIARKLYEEALPDLNDPKEIEEVKNIIARYNATLRNCEKFNIDVPGYSKGNEDLEVKIYDIKAKRSEIIFLHQIDHFDFDGKSNFQWRIILRTSCKLRKTGVLYVMADKYHEVEKLWKNWNDNNNG